MTTIVPQLLTITDLAAEKAATMLKDKGYEEGSLRVFVVGGGCSGHQYGMALATEKEEGKAMAITQIIKRRTLGDCHATAASIIKIATPA